MRMTGKYTGVRVVDEVKVELEFGMSSAVEDVIVCMCKPRQQSRFSDENREMSS